MAKYDQRLKKMAAEVYDALACDRGAATFTKDDAVDALIDRLADEDADDEIVRAAAQGLIGEVDDVRTSPPKPDQLFDLDGAYALGDGVRVSKSAALVDHGQTALLHRSKNVTKASEALTRAQEEYNRLFPKWREPGVTKAEAVEWWEAQDDES